MILSFTVKNFRSIENQTFDLTASKRIKEFPNNTSNIDKNNILNSCIVYGRNASGKSNFLNAIATLVFLIKSSSNLKHSQKIPIYTPFKFDLLLKDKPTEFEITFITKEKLKFKYRFSFNETSILSEELYLYSSNKPSRLFLREYNKPILFGEYYSGDKKHIESELLENQLFLSKSANRNIKYLKEAYLFLNTIVSITIHNNMIDKFLTSLFAELISQDQIPYISENLKNLLKSADVNITNFEVKDNKFDFPEGVPSELKDNYKYTIKTYHRLFKGQAEHIDKDFLTLDNESLGTQRLLQISAFILVALSEGGIAVIDELDKSLHPLLTRLLIQLFHNPKTNPYNAQLIFASHDSSLLDNEMFRRDQIYFVEKDYYGKSSIYRLSDIKGVRKDVPYDKWYLSGRFNAIPIIEDLELKFAPRS